MKPRCLVVGLGITLNQCGSTPSPRERLLVFRWNANAMALTPAFTVLSPGVVAPVAEIPSRSTGVSNGHGKSGTGSGLGPGSDAGVEVAPDTQGKRF